MQFGTIYVPAKQKSTGGDPTVIQTNEYGKAQESVTQELVAKLMTTMKAAPTPKAGDQVSERISSEETRRRPGRNPAFLGCPTPFEPLR